MSVDRLLATIQNITKQTITTAKRIMLHTTLFQQDILEHYDPNNSKQRIAICFICKTFLRFYSFIDTFINEGCSIGAP